MKDKISKLFDHILKWKGSIPINPIGIYRYNGHKTIYESTTSEDGFNPSEQQILIHRYANRFLSGQYVRFHIKDVDRNYKEIKSNCWQYAIIGGISHGNSTTHYGYIQVSCIIANTMSHENIIIRPNTQVVCEIIPKAWFDELVKMVRIIDKSN